MKILFVLEHFYPYIGGAEKLFYELSTELVKLGFEVTVVTTQFDKAHPLVEYHNGIKIVRVQCKNRFGFTFFSIPAIIKHSKGCNLIHTTTYNAALPSIFVGAIVRKPVYVTFHEVWGQLWKRLPFTSFFEKYAFFTFEKILLHLPFKKFIAVSEFTKSKLIEQGIPESKIVRIYNGIDYRRFEKYHTKSPKVFTYTFFGRLGISKGLNLLLPAAGRFSKDYPASKFKLIIPKQPKKIYDEVMQLVALCGLEASVEILHNLTKDELHAELLRSSCVVIPSYSEGFCFAAAETVALNIPIVSSNKGALKEVVSGKFIKMAGQNEESLYEALENAYHENWEISSIRYFHLSDSVEHYKELYSGEKGK